MDLSSPQTEWDPSSTLGFGTALSMIDSMDGVAELLVGAVRTTGIVSLQAVLLDEGEERRVFGSVGPDTLPDETVAELKAMEDLSFNTTAGGVEPARREISVSTEECPALAAHGIDRLYAVPLNTIEHDFGILIAGLPEGSTCSSTQYSSLQMMAAQASMALHRIRLDQQRKEKEEALRRSEARYRELYENAPVAYVSVDPEGEIHMANRRAADLLATSQDTLIGQSVTGFCADERADSAAVRRLVDCIRGNDRLYNEEIEVCTADGGTIWVRTSVQPTDSAEGRPECLVTMVDITERVELEKSLREARDHLEERVEERTAELETANEQLHAQAERLDTLQDIDQAILGAKSPGEIAMAALRRVLQLIDFHRASVAVIDWEEDQATLLATRQEDEILESGTTIPLDDFFLPDTLKEGRVEYAPHFAKRTLPRAAKKLREEMGIRSVLAFPMVVEGDVIGVLHFAHRQPAAFSDDDREIGQELADHLAIALRQSRLFEELQDQRERLEERVQERTAELESFTYSVSHDLRVPLRAIDGYTRILREDYAERLDEEGQRLLDTVCESTQTMQDLIDDLLTLSRVGRHEMNPTPIDMEALVRETYAELCRSRSHADDVAFELGTLPDARADRSMAGHLLTNLLSNAIKYSQNEEAPRVEIDGRERDGKAVYHVRDNGVGFDMEYADKLFGVFQRLHDEDDFEGTGVGLAIVKRIVRRHDGEVWARSTEGQGASFYFTLPLPEDTGP